MFVQHITLVVLSLGMNGAQVVIIGDGQVTAGSQIVKPNVKKVRRMQSGVIGGFAGSTADAFTLFERLEMKLEEHPGEWRQVLVMFANRTARAVHCSPHQLSELLVYTHFLHFSAAPLNFLSAAEGKESYPIRCTYVLFSKKQKSNSQFPVPRSTGQLIRAAVELAKAWRSDKYLRRLEATMVVADKDHTFQIHGNGDVIEPHDGVTAIGSGGHFAVAASRALIDIAGMDALTIAKKAMNIAADSCVYTNHNFTIETLDGSTGAELVAAEPVIAAEPAVAVAEKESETTVAAAPPGITSPTGGKKILKGGDKADKGAADGATGK